MYVLRSDDGRYITDTHDIDEPEKELTYDTYEIAEQELKKLALCTERAF